ncbi:MAG: MFS transporter [Myxococcota bacterium]
MRWRLLGIVGSLYVAQFIPFSFTNMALPIILRKEGFAATDIGLIQLTSLPYVFKFLWAPLIDRVRLGRDHYKTWILALSTIHLVGIVALAFVNPGGPLLPLVFSLLIASLAVSTQDVAVDAFVISIMRPDERTMGSMFQNAGLYAGAIVGGFGFMSVYDRIGWQVALLAQAGLFALPLIPLFFVPEPSRPSQRSSVDLRAALQFFTQPGMAGWLLILGLIRLPLVLTLIPMRLMMVDQGMSMDEIAVWFGLFSMCAGGGATLILGPTLRALPRGRATLLVAFLNVPAIVVIAFIGAIFPSAIRYAIIVAWTAIAIIDIVMFRSAMENVRPEMPGFDFSAQIAVYFVLAGLLDPVIGSVIDSRGYLPAFLVTLPLALVPVSLVLFGLTEVSKPQASR